MSNELISRQAVKEKIGFVNLYFRAHGQEKYLDDLIDEISPADAVEVVHGRWEKMAEADYKCSVCGFRFTSCDPVSMFLYCRCGAKMDGERREEDG